MKLVIGVLIGALFVCVALAVLAVLWFMPVSSADEPGDTVHLIPYDLAAVVRDDGSAIELTWTAVEREGVYLTVQRSRSGRDGSWEDLDTLDPGATSFADNAVESGQTYHYRLKAAADDGSTGQTSTVAVTVP